MGKGVVNDSPGRFRAVALVPIGDADPISQFRTVMLPAGTEAHDSDHLASFLERYCQGHAPAFIEAQVVGGDPFLGSTVLIGIRDEQGGLVDLRITEKLLDATGVRDAEGPK